MLSATIKRGDSFQPAMSVLDGTAPKSIAGWVIISQIRASDDTLIATLEVFDRNDSLGTYNLRPITQYPETGWPLGVADWDIQYTDGNGRIFSTQTIKLRIEKDIARPT